MSRRDDERLADILASVKAIRAHLARGDLSDGLVSGPQSRRTCRRWPQQLSGFSMFALVEVMGLEPTASSMRPKRSSQLSYTPEMRVTR